MTSLGENSYGGTINCNTLRYINLDPPMPGGITNPLSGTLDGGNQDITNVNALTTGTLNYTTLNPPIPTGFIVNPMIANLDAGNFNITNINALQTNGSITASGNVNGDEIIATSKVEGGSGLITGNLEVQGNFTNGGLCKLNGGLLTNSSGNSTFDNRVIFNVPPSFRPSVFGSIGSPVALTPLSPVSGITTFTLAPNKSSVVVFGHPNATVDTYSTAEIATPFSNVLRDYEITVSQATVNGGVPSIPYLSVNIGESTKTPGDTTKFQFVIEHGASPGYTSQVLKYVVKLTYVG